MSRPSRKIEADLQEKGIQYIAGVDEAGRGPLAGPVVSAAVILPHGFYHKDINDSKKLSAKKRKELFKTIKNEALSIGIGMVEVEVIDSINILRATHLSMRLAIQKLDPQPEFVLIDGKDRLILPVPQKAIIGGDASCFSIAAASIIAKETRDRIMLRLHKLYPEYELNRHKGYGTLRHFEKIAQYGLSPIHRRSFLSRIMTPQIKIPLDIPALTL